MTGGSPYLTLPYSLAVTVAGNIAAFAFWQGKLAGMGIGDDIQAALQDAHADVALNMDLPVEGFRLVPSCDYQYPAKASIRH